MAFFMRHYNNYDLLSLINELNTKNKYTAITDEEFDKYFEQKSSLSKEDELIKETKPDLLPYVKGEQLIESDVITYKEEKC